MHGVEMRLPSSVGPSISEESFNTDEDYVQQLIPKLVEARLDVAENTKALQAANKSRYDQKAKAPVFQLGDQVLLFNPAIKAGQKGKLNRRYGGPYYITKLISPHTYLLRETATHKCLPSPVTADRLRPYIDRRDQLEPEDRTDDSVAPSGPGTDATTEQSQSTLSPWFPAEKISKMKFVNRKRYYQVVWQDKTCDPSWVEESAVSDALKQE